MTSIQLLVIIEMLSRNIETSKEYMQITSGTLYIVIKVMRLYVGASLVLTQLLVIIEMMSMNIETSKEYIHIIREAAKKKNLFLVD